MNKHVGYRYAGLMALAVSFGLCMTSCGDVSDPTASADPSVKTAPATSPAAAPVPRARKPRLKDMVIGLRNPRPAMQSRHVIEENGEIELRIKGNGPELGPARIYEVTPDSVFEISFTFEIVELVGKGVPAITAVSLDETGEPTSDTPYSVALRRVDYTPGQRQTVKTRFALDPENSPGAIRLADPERVKFVRFIATPARKATGTRARFHEITVLARP